MVPPSLAKVSVTEAIEPTGLTGDGKRARRAHRRHVGVADRLDIDRGLGRPMMSPIGDDAAFVVDDAVERRWLVASLGFGRRLGSWSSSLVVSSGDFCVAAVVGRGREQRHAPRESVLHMRRRPMGIESGVARPSSTRVKSQGSALFWKTSQDRQPGSFRVGPTRAVRIRLSSSALSGLAASRRMTFMLSPFGCGVCLYGGKRCPDAVWTGRGHASCRSRN